jgi:hypothetical protein
VKKMKKHPKKTPTVVNTQKDYQKVLMTEAYLIFKEIGCTPEQLRGIACICGVHSPVNLTSRANFGLAGFIHSRITAALIQLLSLDERSTVEFREGDFTGGPAPKRGIYDLIAYKAAATIELKRLYGN